MPNEMTNYADYFTWLADGGWIRISARAIIFNHAQDKILIENNFGNKAQWVNFIGGGVETGETLQECIARELAEETDAQIAHIQHLFVVENIFYHGDDIRHAVDHIFQVELVHDDIVPTDAGVEFLWAPISELHKVDLRPVIVRDRIIDGTYKDICHLVLCDEL